MRREASFFLCLLDVIGTRIEQMATDKRIFFVKRGPLMEEETICIAYRSFTFAKFVPYAHLLIFEKNQSKSASICSIRVPIPDSRPTIINRISSLIPTTLKMFFYIRVYEWRFCIGAKERFLG